MSNVCAGRGLLGPVRYPIPRTASVFYAFWGQRSRVVCSNIQCSACGKAVRSHPGLRLTGGPEVVAEAYASDDPAQVAGVRRGLADHRLYLCMCSWYSCGDIRSLDLADTMPEVAPPKSWGCAGHPLMHLPAVIDGVSIAAAPDWSVLIEDAFRAPVDPKKPGAAVRWLREAYGALSGTEQASAIDLVIRSMLEGADPLLRGQALHYLASPLAPPSTDLLPTLLAKDAAGLAEASDPLGRFADQYDLAICALSYHMGRGRWAYDGELRDAIRAHAATPGRLAGVGWLFPEIDREWFLAHVDSLLANSPDTADKVAHWRRAAGG